MAPPLARARARTVSLYIGTLALVDSFFLGPSAKVYRLNPADANLSRAMEHPDDGVGVRVMAYQRLHLRT